MKITLIDVNPSSLPPPSPSFWHRLGKSVGRLFRTVGDFPSLLLQVAHRVKNAVENLFKSSSIIISKDSLPIIPSKSASSHLTHVFQEILPSNTEKLDTERRLEEAEEEEILPKDDFFNPALYEKVEIEQLSAPQVTTQSEGTSPSIKQVINVPDDGNCLFYAVAVGLRKKLPESLPQWNVSNEQLTGDLSKESALLKEPAKTLRQEAATYLNEHIQEDEITLALMEGIYSHQEIANKKIKEEEETLPFLQTDIEDLKSFQQTEDIINQLEQKTAQLQSTQDSIEFQKQHLPSEDNLNSYIKVTEEDHVYCGAPQLYALSKQYDVPIKILYRFEQPDQFEQIFNASSQKPLLTVAHVNGNHFKYIDS